MIGTGVVVGKRGGDYCVLASHPGAPTWLSSLVQGFHRQLRWRPAALAVEKPVVFGALRHDDGTVIVRITSEGSDALGRDLVVQVQAIFLPGAALGARQVTEIWPAAVDYGADIRLRTPDGGGTAVAVAVGQWAIDRPDLIHAPAVASFPVAAPPQCAASPPNRPADPGWTPSLDHQSTPTHGQPEQTTRRTTAVAFGLVLGLAIGGFAVHASGTADRRELAQWNAFGRDILSADGPTHAPARLSEERRDSVRMNDALRREMKGLTEQAAILKKERDDAKDTIVRSQHEIVRLHKNAQASPEERARRLDHLEEVVRQHREAARYSLTSAQEAREMMEKALELSLEPAPAAQPAIRSIPRSRSGD